MDERAERDGGSLQSGADEPGSPETRREDDALEGHELPREVREAVPDWEDPYLDRVSARLMHSYDLEKDVRVGSEQFDLYGELRVESSKHLFHPSVTYANHHMREFLYADRRAGISVADVERLVDLGHELADERVEASDQHRATEFTFVLVVPELPEEVRTFVDGFTDRTLLKYGFHGHYEIHCCVVAPDEEAVVSSARTEIGGAFALWDPLEEPRGGILGRLSGLFSR
ncbi:hypothetical protein [Natrarchaeobaculum aegyptiacum]|uniref:DUF8052 domain-containing protein n=1 Tax=Natrarchaeobaculum aegyptiacum TaxID=745377 RepID=A0A2Z2HU20_9EURY|nr:hypothetical protein [Natrarchaeobaculum aegyptiacum]ARS90710.1 hypothetical protein B1756_13870 [Natrarchaeobaculum aegyptiacum]